MGKSRKRCPHGRVKYDCAACNPCPHGRLKNHCLDCSPCPHGKLKDCCAACRKARAVQPSVKRIKPEPLTIHGYFGIGE